MTEKELRKIEKVKLFAHKGEAIVFWICVAALVFWAVTSLFRYFYLEKAVDSYNQLTDKAHPVILQLKELRAENESLMFEQDSLKQIVSALEDSALQIRSDLSKIQNKKTTPAAPPAAVKPKGKVRILPDN